MTDEERARAWLNENAEPHSAEDLGALLAAVRVEEREAGATKQGGAGVPGCVICGETDASKLEGEGCRNVWACDGRVRRRALETERRAAALSPATLASIRWLLESGLDTWGMSGSPDWQAKAREVLEAMWWAAPSGSEDR